MVWDCFSYKGVRKLVFIVSSLNIVNYINLLAENLQSSADLMGLDNFIFQQDNAPSHKSRLTMSYFTEKTFL